MPLSPKFAPVADPAHASPEMTIAAQRLDQAVSALETRMRALKDRGARGEGDLFDRDRARLAEDLDAARARQKALEAAAAEASEALALAIAEISAVLGDGGIAAMATVTVEVNGRPYPIGCADGQEDRVGILARRFDEHVRQVAADVGAVGDLRLFLMAALLVSDELVEVRSELARLQADHGAQADAPERAALALQSAAERIEKLLAD